MKSEPIVAKTRKLKAVWTPEFAQDLNAYHALDAEAELTSIMSEYISLEIDLEIMDMLIENASQVLSTGQQLTTNNLMVVDLFKLQLQLVVSTTLKVVGSKL
jgi:hypothetical protein